MLVILVSVQLWIKEYEKLCANFFVYQKSSFESVLDDWQLFQKMFTNFTRINLINSKTAINQIN